MLRIGNKKLHGNFQIGDEETIHLISSWWVSVCLLGLHLNHWCVPMKYLPDCELLSTSWPPFESLTCTHESLPGCELLFAFWLPFQSLTCSRAIPSRPWVALLALIWFADLHLAPMNSLPAGELLFASISVADVQPCNPFQGVSCSSGLHLIRWLAPMNSLPAGELLSAFHPYLNRWHVVMKSLPVCEFLSATRFADVQPWIPFSMWVAVPPGHLNRWLVPSLWVAARPGLLSNCWRATT